MHPTAIGTPRVAAIVPVAVTVTPRVAETVTLRVAAIVTLRVGEAMPRAGSEEVGRLDSGANSPQPAGLEVVILGTTYQINTPGVVSNDLSTLRSSGLTDLPFIKMGTHVQNQAMQWIKAMERLTKSELNLIKYCTIFPLDESVKSYRSDNLDFSHVSSKLPSVSILVSCGKRRTQCAPRQLRPSSPGFEYFQNYCSRTMSRFSPFVLFCQRFGKNVIFPSYDNQRRSLVQCHQVT